MHIAGPKNTLWHKATSMTQFWGVWCRHICERLWCAYVCVCICMIARVTPENTLKVVQLHIWISSFCKSFLNVWILLRWWQILPQLILCRFSLTASCITDLSEHFKWSKGSRSFVSVGKFNSHLFWIRLIQIWIWTHPVENSLRKCGRRLNLFTTFIKQQFVVFTILVLHCNKQAKRLRDASTCILLLFDRVRIAFSQFPFLMLS